MAKQKTPLEKFKKEKEKKRSLQEEIKKKSTLHCATFSR